MTIGRERKVETRFARRAAAGKGVGVDEAVAAAEARIDGMREAASARIAAMLQAMQAARPGVAGGDPEAMRFVHGQADALVGLADLFGLPEIGKAAFSLCQLFDGCKPHRPSPDGVRVHLDAMAMFSSLDAGTRAAAAPQVLEGLRLVASAGRSGRA